MEHTGKNDGATMDFSGLAGKQTLAQMSAGAESALTQAKKEESKKPPLRTRKWSLAIKYTDPKDGEPLRAVVVMRAPTAKDRDLVAVLRAQLCNGIPYSQYAVIDQERISSLATVAVLLEDVPTWLDSAMREDTGALFLIATEVVLHEALYFRGDDGAGSEGAQEPRVHVESGPLTD